MNRIYSTNRKFNRMFVNILCIVVMLAMPFPVIGTAHAQDELIPFFRVFPNQNAVDGGNWPVGATVHMAIDDPATVDNPDYEQDADVVASGEGWISNYVRFDFDGTYDLKRGDKVTLTAGEISRYQVVPNLWVTTLDVENNIIGGKFEGTDAGTTVHVFIGGGAEMYVSTDSDGAWVADFDDVGFDLLPGMQGAVEVWFDEFNDSTIFNWNVPWLIAFPKDEAVEGWEWPEGATVTLTINNAPGQEWNGTAEVTSWGDPRTYVRIEFGENYNLKVSDEVTLTDGTTTIKHIVQNLSVMAVNTKADTVNGMADPGAVVQAWPHGFDQTATVQMIVDVNGGWQANFGAVGFDVAEGIGGRSQLVVDGNATAVDWNADHTYDIYAYNALTGAIQQITYLANTNEYNPRWSPDGTKIVHDAWSTDWSSHTVYITDVKSGVSTLLAGAESGSYPIWSPNGKWIAFDRGGDNDYRVFIVPPTGGVPKLVSEDAFMASWSPDSKRLAFHQQSDGSIHTIELKTGEKTLVVENGNAPAWSPDGDWIAFERDGDIWKVNVDKGGNPIGDPIQLTSSPLFEARPTWSNNNKMLAFHASMGGDADIWTVPAVGGTETWLNGAPIYGDYDANYSPNGRYISYSSFSPDGQAARQWVSAFTYDLPAGYWTEGTHTYHFEATWNGGSETSEDVSFNVSSEAQAYDAYVLLRPGGVRAGPDCAAIDAIRLDQSTHFLAGWTTINEMSYYEAAAFFDSLTARAAWDDGQSAELARHEIITFNSDDWLQYVCTFTSP